MYKIIKIISLSSLLCSPLFADWLEDVKDIHTEIQVLTDNTEGLGDAQR